MAAGIGSRYGGLKQIDPVGPSGEVVLDYAIYDAVESGFEKVIFVIRKQLEAPFRQKLGKTIEKHVETEYVFQELDDLPEGYRVPPGREKPWGTAHALLCAAGPVTGPFAAINADDFYGRKSFQVLGDYLAGAEDKDEFYDYCMVGFTLANTLTPHGHVARGICTIGRDGNLAGIVERTKIKQFPDAVRYTEDGTNWIEIDPQSTVSMNMWGFTRSFLSELEARFPAFLDENIDTPKGEYFVPTVVNHLISEGKARVKVLPTDEKWFGVTYKQDRETVQRAIMEKVNRGIYPRKLWD